MNLMNFENEWRDFAIFNGKTVVSLRVMLVRSRGICTIDGCKAINFESANEDVDPMILRLITDAGGTIFCLRWDDNKEEWERFGCLVPANEWSTAQLERHWKDCAIQPVGTRRILNFRDIFSSCIGERYEGVAFTGKGKYDGENFLIRPNCDKQLANYYDDQRCERFNKEDNEWEFWGMLVKHVPA